MAIRSFQIAPEICKNKRTFSREEYAFLVQTINSTGCTDEEAFNQLIAHFGYTLDENGKYQKPAQSNAK